MWKLTVINLRSSVNPTPKGQGREMVTLSIFAKLAWWFTDLLAYYSFKKISTMECRMEFSDLSLYHWLFSIYFSSVHLHLWIWGSSVLFNILLERCDANCSYCWGPGPEECQERNKVTCAPQCDHRCFGPGAHECCKLGCLAGCSGPVDTDCWVSTIPTSYW